MSENLENLNRTRPSLTGFTGLYTELADGLNAVVNIDEEGNYVGPLDGVLPFVTVGFGSGFDYVCDGVADDVQINAAITAVNAAGGGEVRFAAGTYNTVATILLKSKVALVGAGIQKTIIKGSTSDYKVLATTKSGTTKDVYNNISLSNLTVLSQKGHCTNFNNIDTLSVTDCEFYFSGTSTIRESLWCQHCKNVVFNQNYLHDLTGNGVQVNSTDFFTVSNNIVNGGSNSDDGIDIDYDFLDTSLIHSQYGTVTGNVVNNIVLGNGIRVENSDFVTVDSNYANSSNTGIIVNSTAAGVTLNNVTVTGNVCRDCTSNGILIQEGAGTTMLNITVSSNSIYNCGITGGSNVRGGIQLSAQKVLCVGNSIYGTSKTGADGAAIIVYKKSNQVIADNLISNSVTGIRLWNGDGLQSYAAITLRNNHVDTNVTTPYVLAALATGITLSVGPNNADYLTDGTADDVQIQAALDAINTFGGGIVSLQEGTFNLVSNLTIGSNTQLIGSGPTTILKKGAGLNTTVMNNKDGTNGNSFITIKNLTIDQQGTTQSAGGGISIAGLRNSTIENVTFEKSYVFNLFIGSVPGTTLSGTITVTAGSETVAGSGTSFLTQVSAGDILKTSGGRFIRVQSVTSDTVLVMDRIWGHATETGVTYKLVPANNFNTLRNCTFKGTVGSSDNVGLGLFDDCLIENCVSTASTGYGFGPDHSNRAKFIGNTAYSNSNSGIGAETCGYCVFADNELYSNGNGIYLLSGAYRNIISNNVLRSNTIGVHVTYNSTSFPIPSENSILGNVCDNNTTHGIRVGGGVKTNVSNNRCFNNGLSGIVTVTDNASIPTNTLIAGNHCYDNQTVKTQNYGIWISGGTDTMVVNNVSKNSDAISNGILNSGTNTSIVNNAGVNPVVLYPQGNVTGATTFNRLNGNIITSTLTGDITVTLTNGISNGDELTLVLTQDGTGGRTATWPSNAKFALGNSGLVLSRAPSAVDTITFIWDGTNWREKNRAVWIRTPRTVTMADATSFTMTGDTADINVQTNTQAIGTLTANAPSGTPVNGQLLQLELKSTNVQTFSWNAIFASSNDVVLPTASTGATKTDLMLFRYNSAATKWYIVAKSLGY